jgi:hypothetical protein
MGTLAGMPHLKINVYVAKIARRLTHPVPALRFPVQKLMGTTACMPHLKINIYVAKIARRLTHSSSPQTLLCDFTSSSIKVSEQLHDL